MQLVPEVRGPAVEVVVAEPVEVEAHEVHELDRGLVAEERRDRRGRPDRVARGQRRDLAGRLGAVGVEPRLQERRAADRERRVGGARARHVVRRLGQRRELAVVVGDVEDLELVDLVPALDDVQQHLAARVLRLGDVHQVGDGRREVDRPHALDVLGGRLDVRPRRDERRVHVDVPRDVDEVGQVAVLTEELRRSDELSRRLRVGLVRRPEDDDDVAAAARMERVGAVDVLQLLLLHHLRRRPAGSPGRFGSSMFWNAAMIWFRTAS